MFAIKRIFYSQLKSIAISQHKFKQSLINRNHHIDSRILRNPIPIAAYLTHFCAYVCYIKRTIEKNFWLNHPSVTYSCEYRHRHNDDAP